MQWSIIQYDKTFYLILTRYIVILHSHIFKAKSLKEPCLCPRCTNVFNVFNATDAVVVDFTAGQTDIVPKTPLAI